MSNHPRRRLSGRRPRDVGGVARRSTCWWTYEDGKKTNPVMKVFVATELGTPPQQFSTGGHQGNLHFGYLNFGGQNQAIYFVLHPSDWYPYQHRFKTNSFTKFFKDGLSNVASTAGGAAAG